MIVIVVVCIIILFLAVKVLMTCITVCSKLTAPNTCIKFVQQFDIIDNIAYVYPSSYTSVFTLVDELITPQWE